MDRSRAMCWLVASVILLELVCGAPFFFSLPERECEQPPPYESYQQPGPNYQDSLQQMMREAMVALRDIVLITAQVTSRELHALARDLYNKMQRGCDNEGVEDVDKYNSDNGQSVELPGEHEENNPAENGYHYYTPNKKFAMENTIPNPHDTENEIENHIDSNKQIFENEISTEETTKSSELTTDMVETTFSNEDITTELVVESTATTS